MGKSEPLDRRRFVVGVSAGLGGVALTTTQGQPPGLWRFFTDEEARLVDAISEQIIPADQHAGARDVGVVNFIDRQLVGHYQQHQPAYRQGLIGVMETSQAMFGQGFLALAWPQQTQVLGALETGNAAGATWQRASSSDFFRLLRNHSLQGFYGSPRHGGNRGYASYHMLGLDYPQIIGRQLSREETRP